MKKIIATEKEYRFSSKKLIRHMGGGKALFDIHAKYAPKFGWENLPQQTIYKWNISNSVPPKRIAEIYTLGMIIGCPVTAEVMVSPIDDKLISSKRGGRSAKK